MEAAPPAPSNLPTMSSPRPASATAATFLTSDSAPQPATPSNNGETEPASAKLDTILLDILAEFALPPRSMMPFIASATPVANSTKSGIQPSVPAAAFPATT